jgi:hypothetical protein
VQRVEPHLRFFADEPDRQAGEQEDHQRRHREPVEPLAAARVLTVGMQRVRTEVGSSNDLLH